MPQESGRSDGLPRFSSAWKRRNPASADAAQEALSDVPSVPSSQAIRVLPCKSTEPAQKPFSGLGLFHNCLLYTSDAADDLLCVVFGGRRIIEKTQSRCL